MADVPVVAVGPLSAPPQQGRARRRSTGVIKSVLTGLALFVFLSLLWEGYKAFGRRYHDRLPGTDWKLPVATDDLAMPHVVDIIGGLFDPAQRGSDRPLILALLSSATSTLFAASVGLLIAFVIGFGLALMLLRFGPIRRGLTPWIVASQTIPLVAIAPMVVIWGGKAELPSWMVIATIAAYLAFFPITVNSLRGLTSPDNEQLDLMRTYAATQTSTLMYLRVPTSLPFVFTGLRLAATAAVVGAIVGELSAGTGKGIGADLLTYSYFYTNGPEKLYGAVIIASLVGVVFVQAIALADRWILKNRNTHD